MAGIAKAQLPPLTWLHCQSGHIALTKQVLWGLSKDLRSPQLVTRQATKPVQQTSCRSSAAKPPLPRLRAKQGKGETMQGFQAWQENRSPGLQCIRYLREIPVWLIILHETKSPSNAPPNPRHDKDSEATQHTQPDHRPGRHQPSNQPWVSVRSQWAPSRHDLKSAPLAGWEINLPWTATVPRYNLKPAP